MRLFSDTRILVDYYECDKNVLNITFSGFTSIKNRMPFGVEISNRFNQSSLIITARSNHYYHYNDFMESLIFFKKIVSKYKKVNIISCGMGGYAAIKTSRFFNANTVIVISPLLGNTYTNIDFYNKDYEISIDDISGEIFYIYDDKNHIDEKNLKYLLTKVNVNFTPFTNTGHIAYYALNELSLIDYFFMGRGEINLTKFFISKAKHIFNNIGTKSVTVFCNYYSSMNEENRKKIISDCNIDEMRISNHRSDKFNEILARHCNTEADKFYLQAIYLEKEGKKEDAKKMYKLALQLNPNKIYWNFQLARLFQNLKDFNSSKIYYETAIDLALCDNVYNNFVSDWSNRLGIVYEKMNQRNEARKYYGLSLSTDVNKRDNHEFRFNLNSNDFEETKKIAQFVSDVLPICKKTVESYTSSLCESNYVFVYWGQGISNAPEVVKKCINSIITNTKDLNLIILDDNNILNYIDIPKNILNKFKNNEMNHAHYSDILRLLLLKKFGGCWIDATCFLNSQLNLEIPKILGNSEFFAFMYEKPMISNWFLVAKKNSYIVDLMLSSLLEYWNSYLDLKYYFCFHAIFYSLYIKDEKFKKILDQSMYISTKIPHKFQFVMMDNFDKKKSEEILNGCFIHKLTYKFDESKFLGSYLDMLIKS
ncbi:capsular polysaccharide synthesis protein [Acinetobacter lwoffii]|uniref:Capsular polysaccharide synthesis protein n=1 Tax=Acinetobacter lwoffii TaxID=28090 RepID=A0AAW8AU66_ACILW|nr:capsular polysaccharide synthesis protein [Acinetobacter lwoffii]MDP1369840.1 capsular polysaccharide synthesis protein [Acinetobacter lwoffii]MDP1389277.1 capsular polysaccharide synthesis protein [Acinetobacter lwoffii]MDP1446943.1 capsular polysaccharide synthesis protein [Acinetobacter lwoffii]